MKFRTPVIIASAMAVSACGINSVPTADENVKAKWADVQADYQRRADLINARAKATSINVTADDLSDANKMQQFQQAQGQLNGSLSRLLANVEAYPQLKSQDNFQTLMSQLEGTENRVTIAIRDYNAAVQAYNTRIRTFPDAIGAKVFYGAKPKVPYQATTPGAENAPTVDFGNMS